MKAFILAAGHGTRLRPITNNIPKCLVPIRGMPMLEIWLEICFRAGIDEVFLNLHAHADVARSAVNRFKHGPKVVLSEEQTLLGSAGTLRENRDWVSEEEQFWVFYGDVLTNLDLQKMLAFHEARPLSATIGVYRVSDPWRCGIVEFDEDHRVLDFTEKPDSPKGNWAFSGVMIGTAELLDAIPEDLPCDLGFHVLPRLVGQMRAYPISEYLLDIGTMKNYQEAQAQWPGLTAEAGARI